MPLGSTGSLMLILTRNVPGGEQNRKLVDCALASDDLVVYKLLRGVSLFLGFWWLYFTMQFRVGYSVLLGVLTLTLRATARPQASTEVNIVRF